MGGGGAADITACTYAIVSAGGTYQKMLPRGAIAIMAAHVCLCYTKVLQSVKTGGPCSAGSPVDRGGGAGVTARMGMVLKIALMPKRTPHGLLVPPHIDPFVKLNEAN